MDGLLIVDKPVGPTSHDVVQRVRRAIGQRRIGHTGTLDPAASGVLPLVVGRATRLAWLLTAVDKTYQAVVRFGLATDTYDSMGKPVGDFSEAPPPEREDIERALEAFRGRFMQQPPAYSAKKVGGVRSYEMARASERAGREPIPAPAPVSVTVRRLEIAALDRTDLTLEVECSAGFYVRALAHDLGQRLGSGAHLAALRRIRSGDASLANAVALDTFEQDGQAAERALIPLERMLPKLAALTLTPEGMQRTRHGRDLAADHFCETARGAASGEVHGTYRLFDPEGHLVAIAEATTPGLLHPWIVLV